jgi:transposase
MTHTPNCVGIDVSRAQLDMALRDTLVYDAAGIDTLVARLRHVAPTLIVLEATGGWERPLVRAVIVANPRHVHDCAKATGQLAKTDRLDSGMLARFAEAVQPTLRPHPDAATDALAALLVRRRQLLDMLTAEKSRLSTAPTRVQCRIRAHVT